MPYLIYAPETSFEQIYGLTDDINTIGRSLDNTIVIDDLSVSRRHAIIEVTEEKIKIKDLKSSNSTLVNKVKIDQEILKEGDVITFGNIDFKFSKLTQNSPQNQLENTPKENLNINDETSQLSPKQEIVKQYSIDTNTFDMQALVTEQSYGSVIKLKHQTNVVQRTLDKLKVLLEVSKQLSSPEEPDRLLDKILELLFDIIKVDRAAILMVNEKSEELEAKAIKVRKDLGIEGDFYSTKIINLVYNSGDTVVTSDAYRDQRFSDSHSVLGQEIHASMCIPFKPRDKVIGVLYVDNLEMGNIYSDEDVDFLTALTNQAAIAIDNAKLYEKMQLEAIMRDKLERFFPQSVAKKLKEEEQLGIIETEVTALFADISGFTKMSSTMKPKEIILMLNEYFQVMVEEIIFKYEGTLEKYIGDALFAVWGAPYQKSDDPIQAVKAAIHMQWAVQSLNKRWIQQGKQPISIHIGINTGKVAAGNIGSKKLVQYATIGDTTNVTSRICNVAQPNQIVISHSTYERIHYLDFSLEKMPLIKVKGKSNFLQLYLLNWKDTILKR